MCSVYPGMLPQMLAYSNINIQAQLQFSRDSWLTYDQISALLPPPAGTPPGGMSMPAQSGRSCQLCCSTAQQPPQPAHRGWMNQPHRNSLQQYRPPGTPGRCSPGPHTHRSAPCVASEGAATTATFVPFASFWNTATKSVPHLPGVPGACLGGP